MPVRGRLSRSSGKDNFLLGAQKFDIKPSGNAVHVGCVCRCELKRYFYTLQLDVTNASKIEVVDNRTVEKKRWIERIDNRLGEVRL